MEILCVLACVLYKHWIKNNTLKRNNAVSYPICKDEPLLALENKRAVLYAVYSNASDWFSLHSCTDFSLCPSSCSLFKTGEKLQPWSELRLWVYC